MHSNPRARVEGTARLEPKYWKPLKSCGQERPKDRRPIGDLYKTYTRSLLRRARQVVGQGPRLARKVGRALVVALAERSPSLVQEILRSPDGLLLPRLHLSPFQLAQQLLHVADVLPGGLQEPLLFLG